ncbi:MAG TPA: SUMF1/EgtB/PvdO family nonheme iron enzyme [Burkholderiaceae bacterium]|nr:SUMF1/EgtB/PvdO family nonheme iron enzyme [Burkholderiaceae bacterium]
MDALEFPRAAYRLHDELRTARAHADALFRLVAPETLYARPIADRHRLIFYAGHLDAFDWNQLARGVLDLPAFAPSFDRLFEAGIDPEPGQAPDDDAGDWPALAEVQRYVERTRATIDAAIDRLPSERLLTALEHRWMHAETLCYLLHELPPELKRAPDRFRHEPILAPATTTAWTNIPGGPAQLGQRAGQFGWDNEFPAHEVTVPEFRLAHHKVTNGEYLGFVAAGGPAPHFWTRAGERWMLRRMFGHVPLPLNEPVLVTQRQATAYAGWAGARLPTEAEWQRAAYGAGHRSYPWGDAPPTEARAQLDFTGWDTVPVGANRASATPEGAEQMLGNGWEWTSTPFHGYAGFRPRTYYPGYSANFFDGAHFVLKGGSVRTAARLARPSFRNWFRAEYPYMYATMRLAA